VAQLVHAARRLIPIELDGSEQLAIAHVESCQEAPELVEDLDLRLGAGKARVDAAQAVG
jgi:hypothetical protein